MTGEFGREIGEKLDKVKGIGELGMETWKDGEWNEDGGIRWDRIDLEKAVEVGEVIRSRIVLE